MSMTFAAPDSPSVPLHVIEASALEGWLKKRGAAERAWITSSGFSGGLGEALAVPGPDGAIAMALAGYGSETARARGRFNLAAARAALPEGTYRLETLPKGWNEETELLGWLLADYAFDRYRAQSSRCQQLVRPKGDAAARAEAMAAGEALSRDLINTPSSDMDPGGLEDAAHTLAEAHGAKVHVIRGNDLIAQNFPMIHAVGRASASEPRLIDMTWGSTGPALTLVGKGICFDTGGLNIKPGASMGLMKKDMGGAAAVLGLARTIMTLNLPLRLRVLVPAAENSISGNSFRPQDILTSRKGLTVEINNTDAEGRLVLADALALACEDPPDLLISMATLTGAARVALGPDLPPFFSTDDALAEAIGAAGIREADPVWRLPFWEPYEQMIEPGIADLDNAPKGGFAGAITAALFLRRFVDPAVRYAHFDIYGWQPAAAPGRPKGGVQQGARAVLGALPDVLGL